MGRRLTAHRVLFFFFQGYGRGMNRMLCTLLHRLLEHLGSFSSETATTPFLRYLLNKVGRMPHLGNWGKDYPRFRNWLFIRERSLEFPCPWLDSLHPRDPRNPEAGLSPGKFWEHSASETDHGSGSDAEMTSNEAVDARSRGGEDTEGFHWERVTSHPHGDPGPSLSARPGQTSRQRLGLGLPETTFSSSVSGLSVGCRPQTNGEGESDEEHENTQSNHEP